MVWLVVVLRWSQVPPPKTITYRGTVQQRQGRYALSWKFGYSTFCGRFFQWNTAWRKVVNRLPLRVFPSCVFPAVAAVASVLSDNWPRDLCFQRNLVCLLVSVLFASESCRGEILGFGLCSIPARSLKGFHSVPSRFMRSGELSTAHSCHSSRSLSLSQ